MEHDGCGGVSNTVKYEIPFKRQICTQHSMKESNEGTDKGPLKNKDTLGTISEQIFLQLGMLHIFQ